MISTTSIKHMDGWLFYLWMYKDFRFFLVSGNLIENKMVKQRLTFKFLLSKIKERKKKIRTLASHCVIFVPRVSYSLSRYYYTVINNGNDALETRLLWCRLTRSDISHIFTVVLEKRRDSWLLIFKYFLS